jgi:hypothetical protein
MRNAVSTLDPLPCRILGGLLVVCLTLAAVPALAHCCADRCHDAAPAPAPADHCDCELSGVEPPEGALLLTTDTSPDLLWVQAAPTPEDPAPPSRREIAPDDSAPRPAPDRTTVLLI